MQLVSFGDKDRTCDCPKLDEADLGRLEWPVNPSQHLQQFVRLL